MYKLLSLPFMSIAYFAIALVWVVAAFMTYGQPLFWIFLIMIPVNIFAGIKMMQR